MSRHRLPTRRTRRQAGIGLGVIAGLLLLLTVATSGGAASATSTPANAFTKTITATRDHLVDGKDDVVDSRNVTVSVDEDSGLRDHQDVNITWSGAHPTGGIVYDPNSQFAANQEYPVVILQCRGVDSTTVPAAQQLSQQTCYTQTPEERYQGPYRGTFPSYRVDRYATQADRKLTVGRPSPFPDSCIDGDGAERWVPFVAADGTVYHGGYNGCAGLAPEQSVVQNPLTPPNTTFATTDVTGHGSAKFVVQTADSNASLGCSNTVACSIVVVPVMGISCDADGVDALPADRPTDPAAAFTECSQTGFYPPGVAGTQNSAGTNAELPVSGQLWWSASNWRNRITVPLTFAPSASSCNIAGNGSSVDIYGSETLFQATQQWSPSFCLNPKLFALNHVQTSDVQAKNLLSTSLSGGSYTGVEAAFQADPPSPAFSNPIVQAPTAVSGFAISYVMDDAKSHEYTSLKLNARLLAKLMTMSYPAYPDIKADWKSCCLDDKTTAPKYAALANNPLDMAVDPEFLALNPGMKTTFINQLESSATMFMMSSDADVMTSLTSYLNNDPDARAFLNGVADPWGMVVNPNYRNITLPVTSWPLLDTYYKDVGNECIADGKSPILPLIAAPVSDPAAIAFNLQYGISNSQVVCSVVGDIDQASTRKLTAQGREDTGIRFLVGLTSLADARRYQLNTAALQTQNTAKGPTFVQPTDAALRAAAQLFTPDSTVGSWQVPYDKLRTDPAGKNAYPGTMLISTDVPTTGLTSADAGRYADVLRFIAGPGQVAGLNNGQLPPGYLPITAANGLATMVRYTTNAATDVAEQKGVVPLLTGENPPVAPTSPPKTSAPASAVNPPPAGAPSSAPQASVPATVPSGAGSVPSSATSASAAPTTAVAPSAAPTSEAPATVNAVPAGKTRDLSNGAGAWVLPSLLALAVLGALASAWVGRVGRR